MVLNVTGGKGHKKSARARKTKNPSTIFDTNDGKHQYAQVIQKLGHNRLSVKTQSGETVQAVIPGKFMKKVWFNKDDFIVINSENDDYYDVVQKLVTSDMQNLAAMALGTKLDKDDYNIYQTNMHDDSDSDDDNDNNNNNNTNDHKSTASVFRKREKDRDIARKENNRDEFEKPVSIVEKSDNDSDDSDDSTESGNSKDSKDSMGNNKNSTHDDVYDDSCDSVKQTNIKNRFVETSTQDIKNLMNL